MRTWDSNMEAKECKQDSEGTSRASTSTTTLARSRRAPVSCPRHSHSMPWSQGSLCLTHLLYNLQGRSLSSLPSISFCFPVLHGQQWPPNVPPQPQHEGCRQLYRGRESSPPIPDSTQKESIKNLLGSPLPRRLPWSSPSPSQKMTNKGLSLINRAISWESLYTKGEGARKPESLETG